jgi:hypothetical protein
MALARIMYSLFFLWHLSSIDIREVAEGFGWSLPEFYSWLPRPGFFIYLIEPTLVFLLILLLVGLYTRPVSVLLIAIAGYYALLYHALVSPEQLLAFMTFYVPLLGAFSRWGDVYSVDAFRRNSHPDPAENTWIYIWPAKWMLVILAVIYFSAGYYKITGAGTWHSDPLFLSRFLQYKSVISAMSNGSDVSPLAFLIGQQPLLAVPAQYVILFFELSFPLVLISRFVYGVYMRLLPFFHLMNALLLGIPFYLILPAYIMLVNWQHIADTLSLPLERIRRLSIAPGYVIGGALLIALAWNTVFVPRFVFGAGGLFNDNRTLWVVIAGLSLAWYALEFRRYRQRRHSSTETA